VTASDIGEAARIAYAAGIDPVSYAEGEITALIGIHRQLAGHCAAAGLTPDGDLSEGAMSRRILGLLMNADWKPPAANDPLEEL
jgi:hypothetical protein